MVNGGNMVSDYSTLGSLQMNWKDPVHQIRYLRIGDMDLQVQNYENRKILVSTLNFKINAAGKVEPWVAGMEELQSLEELKDLVTRYRLAYKEMKAMEAKLKMAGDFR